LEKNKIELEREMELERIQHFSPTEAEIRDFFTALKNGSEDDIINRKALINTLVNAIYLYDDEITVIFNSTDIPVTVSVSLLGEIDGNNAAVKRSYIEKNGSP